MSTCPRYRDGWHLTPMTDLTPSQIAAAINALLIDHGYPPDKVDGWWSGPFLGQSPPAEQWMLSLTNGSIWRRGGLEAQKFLLENVAAGYAASEAHAPLSPEKLAELRTKVEEMKARYPNPEHRAEVSPELLAVIRAEIKRDRDDFVRVLNEELRKP